jgi:hypothetical protein
MLRPRIAVCVLALIVLFPAAAAGASPYSKVLHTYQQRGAIPPCRFTPTELSSALKAVDLYGQQYFADFTNAIQSALAARAGGACGAHPAGSATPAVPSSGGLSGLKLGSIHATAATQADLPAPLLLLAGLAAAGLLIAATTGLFWLRGWEPAFVPWWRHLWHEAEYRAGGIWAEFVDWLRSA